MALVGYDQSAAANILVDDFGAELARLPASATAGVDGAGVDLTIAFRDLGAAAYTTLRDRAAAAATAFRIEWTLGFPEYGTGDMPFTVRASRGAQRARKRSARVNPIGDIADLTSTSTTMDGVVVVAANRVYLSDQTTGAENGLYRVASVTGANCELTRTEDMDESAEVEPGTEILVSEGTVRSNTKITITNSATITIGTTALTHVRENLAESDVVQMVASGNLAAGDVVYFNGWNVAADLPTMAVGDADIATVGRRRPSHVMRGTVLTTVTGQAYKTTRVTVLAGGAQDDPVYLTATGTTTNTLSLTPPAGGDADVIVVGRVSNVATTRWDIDLRTAAIERLGSRSMNLAMAPVWTALHTFGVGLTVNGPLTINGRYDIEEVAVAFAASPYTPLAGDAHLSVDTSGGAVVIDLATAVGAGLGRRISFKHTAGTAAVSVVPLLLETIDGVNAVYIVKRNGSVTLSCDNVGGWTIVAEHKPGTVVANGDAALDLGVAGLNIEVVTGTPGGGGNTYALPPATGSNRRIVVKNLFGSAGAITVDGNVAETVDGVADVVLAAGQSAALIDNAAGTWIIE